MNISIAIADKNEIYLERLVEVLQEYEDLSISIFTDTEILEKTLQSKKFDVLLFDPDISEKKLSFYNIKMAMCLYSEEAHNTILYVDCEKTIKYQRISKIYKDIIKVFANKAGYIPDFENSQSAKILAVYSPVGGSGKTTIALALANIISSMGNNVLSLCMEQLDSSSCVNIHSEEKEGITVLLESLDESSNFELKLKGITQKGANGISYIEGFERIVDYNSVSKEEIGLVLEKIVRFGNYDVVVVDMESRLDDIGHAIFEMADKIVVVENTGNIADKKMSMFARQALTCEHIGKMFKISNFVVNGIDNKNEFDVPCIANIPDYGSRELKYYIQAITEKALINTSFLL